MDPWVWIVIAVAVIVVLAAIALWFVERRRQRLELREWFGPSTTAASSRREAVGGPKAN